MKKASSGSAVIPDVEKWFWGMRSVEPRKAAEVAYAIAMQAKKENNPEKAKVYGRESVNIFNRLNVQTLKECAAIHNSINGIVIPSLIHADVVRDRLAPLQL